MKKTALENLKEQLAEVKSQQNKPEWLQSDLALFAVVKELAEHIEALEAALPRVEGENLMITTKPHGVAHGIYIGDRTNDARTLTISTFYNNEPIVKQVDVPIDGSLLVIDPLTLNASIMSPKTNEAHIIELPDSDWKELFNIAGYAQHEAPVGAYDLECSKHRIVIGSTTFIRKKAQ